MDQPDDTAPFTPEGLFRGGLRGEALHRVMRFVDERLGESISLADLASLAGVSRFHFARQFRVSTGESPMEYRRRMRIERAKRILVQQSSTIAEVAIRLGFADQSHFTRTFRRMVGVSPGHYIARQQGRSRPAVRELATVGGD
jgi:transcriptional regulator GlxA family with amidase domain